MQFSIPGIIKESWQVLKTNWIQLLLIWGIAVGVQMVLRLIMTGLGEQLGILTVMFSLGSQILAYIMYAGAIKLELDLIRGKEIEVVEIFNQGKKYAWKFFLVSLVYSLIVFGGLLLLFVPGVIWSLKYLFATYATIDDGLGVQEALSLSAKLTDGIKLKMYGLGIVLFFLNVLGLLVFLVGFIVTAAISGLVWPVLYVSLKKQLLAKDGVSEGQAISSAV